jgi:hypothetical protein
MKHSAHVIGVEDKDGHLFLWDLINKYGYSQLENVASGCGLADILSFANGEGSWHGAKEIQEIPAGVIVAHYWNGELAFHVDKMGKAAKCYFLEITV